MKRPTPPLPEHIARALDAWKRSVMAPTWGQRIDTVLTVDWHGVPLARVSYRGEQFDIYRVDTSAMVDLDELTDDESDALGWQAYSLPLPVNL